MHGRSSTHPRLFLPSLASFGHRGDSLSSDGCSIALPLTVVGGWVGYHPQNRALKNPSLSVFVATFLLMGFEEKAPPPPPPPPPPQPPSRGPLGSSVNAPPEKVWNHVVTFSELPPAEDWLFSLGIACPTCVTIEGTGVGAIRHCNFTTGAFVEPITAWDEPNRLAFDVISQPPPMKELSPMTSTLTRRSRKANGVNSVCKGLSKTRRSLSAPHGTNITCGRLPTGRFGLTF